MSYFQYQTNLLGTHWDASGDVAAEQSGSWLCLAFVISVAGKLLGG